MHNVTWQNHPDGYFSSILMDTKTLQILEYDKILERLASYTSFNVSAEKVHNLHPTTDIDEARRLLAETSQAVELFSIHTNISIGGARDVRESLELTTRSGVLEIKDLLDIKSTLIAARKLARTFDQLEDQFPLLTRITKEIRPVGGLISSITRSLSDQGAILDSASPELKTIRRDLRVTHDRLLSKMERIVSDSKKAKYLQETLITQRDGRYVLPLKAEFKGKIKSIVHDQSSSGATLFVEPLSIVDSNNQYKQLQLSEREEERRILANLSNLVGENASNIKHSLDCIADLDLVFARGKYAQQLEAEEPLLHPLPHKDKPSHNKTSKHPGCILRLYQARHPLLPKDEVVPIDLELDPQTFALVITGPNTGGKTVTLKTIGLLSLMALTGLHLPTHSGSEISVFEGIFADIGDEQSIEQSLSTFSSHIKNIIRILIKSNNRSLVILDELGAGTDPQEGAVLGQAILSFLLERGVTTLVTTHHPDLKAFAHTAPGVVNASVDFDLESLRPTYHLTVGIPGRSNALAIAERLGLPQSIIKSARSEISSEDLRAEDLLDEIQRQRDLSREARSAAEKARNDVETLRSELKQRLENIDDERLDILREAQQEATSSISELKKEVHQVRRALTQKRQPLEAIKAVEEKVDQLEDTVEEPVERVRVKTDSQSPPRAVQPGDKVRLRTYETHGVVTDIGEEKAEVQVGALRVRTNLSELEFVGSSSKTDKSAQPQQSKITLPPSSPSPGVELNLRGQRADEARDSLDRYLEDAHSAGLPYIRIVHGKGTGKLRQVVHAILKNHPYINSFQSGGIQEGGEGVTVAKLTT